MKRSFKCMMAFVLTLVLTFTLIPVGTVLAAPGPWVVSFDSQGGNRNPDPVTVADGDSIKYENVLEPYREGYCFNGWYTDPACTDNWDLDNKPVTGNMTLYAGWSPIEHNSDGFYYYDNWFYGGYIIYDYDGTNPFVNIPHDINGKRVYSISPFAFAGNTDIASVTFPALTADELASPKDKEISLNWGAFADCTNLTLVDISNSGRLQTEMGESWYPKEIFYNDTKLEMLTCSADSPFHSVTDGVLFSKDGTILCVYPPAKAGTSYDVPGTVTGIRGTAFQSCQYIETVNIPASVTTIDAMTFGYCPALTQINAATESTVFSSDGGVLFNEAQTELVAFPNGKSGAYVIPGTVTKIRGQAFEVAYNLTSVTVPASVTDLGTSENQTNPFPGPNLTEIVIDPSSPAAKTLNGVLFSKDGTELMSYPTKMSAGSLSMAVTDSLEAPSAASGSYTVPDGVKTIMDYAFYGTTLSSVTIPDSVEAIYSDAFFGNTGVTIKANNLSGAYYYAKDMNIPFYSLNGYQVIFISTKGADVIKQTVAQDGKAVKPANPTREGYDFVGWYTNENCVWDFNTPITDNLLLHAGWKAWKPVGLTLTKTDATTYNGTNGSITATATGGSGQGYEYSINGGTNWQSSSSFTGLAAGSYTVTVRDTGSVLNKASVSAAVGQPGLSGTYTGSKAPSKANAGTAIIINPPAPAKGYTMQSFSYASSNPSVATVDQNGVVTFIAGGKATIVITSTIQKVDNKGKVTTKKIVTKKTITVNQPVASISLNQTSATVARTQKVKLTAQIGPATASNKKLTWKSSNPKVAAVSSAGVVTGKAGGTAVITCTAKDGSGISASCTVTVTPVNPTALKLNKSALTIKTGKTAALKVTIAPKNTDFKTVTWTSSNPAVVSVDAKGKIKALASGTAVITATTSNGIAASCTVTVQ